MGQKEFFGVFDRQSIAATCSITDTYEVERDDYTVTEWLLARYPNAQIWLLRVGHRTAYRIGWRPRRETV